MKFKDLPLKSHFKTVNSEQTFQKLKYRKASCCSPEHNCSYINDNGVTKLKLIEKDVEVTEVSEPPKKKVKNVKRKQPKPIQPSEPQQGGFGGGFGGQDRLSGGDRAVKK